MKINVDVIESVVLEYLPTVVNQFMEIHESDLAIYH